MLIHAWMYCSYYDRLLIMGDDMFIIAYEQAVIMHDQRHIHVIMNIIVDPCSARTDGAAVQHFLLLCHKYLIAIHLKNSSC